MIRIGKCLPAYFFNKLWGNRKEYGKIPNKKDPCWLEWQQMQTKFYMENQRKGVGSVVNDSGYAVMSEIDLHKKCVLEIGPGDMRHHKFWIDPPRQYLIADIHDGMMHAAKSVLDKEGISYESFLVKRNEKLTIEKHSVDVIVTFYSLEHLHPLDDYLANIKHCLKPNGILIGAIPAEGGLLWALGRYFTSRRWLHRNTNIDYDKLICWEHPNFADYIIHRLDKTFERVFVKAWPFPFLPFLDNNLTFKFCYKNRV